MVETILPDGIRLSYGGPAVEDGSMNVRDLAPAMLAVGDLFDATNLLLNGRSANVEVNVRATRTGSFEVFFEIIVNALANPEFREALKTGWELRDMLFGPDGLMALVVASRHGKPLDPPASPIPREISDNPAVRQSIKDIMSPLGHTDIHTLNVFIANEQTLALNQNDYREIANDRSLRIPRPILDEVQRKKLQIVSPTFRPGRNWGVL